MSNTGLFNHRYHMKFVQAAIENHICPKCGMLAGQSCVSVVRDKVLNFPHENRVLTAYLESEYGAHSEQ